MSVTQQVPLEQMNWENPELKSLSDDKKLKHMNTDSSKCDISFS